MFHFGKCDSSAKFPVPCAVCPTTAPFTPVYNSPNAEMRLHKGSNIYLKVQKMINEMDLGGHRSTMDPSLTFNARKINILMLVKASSSPPLLALG